MSDRLKTFLGIAALLLWAAWCLHDYGERGLYPTNDDQMDNLNQAGIFNEHGILYWRAPLYIAWLGAHLRLAGGNPEAAFYLEKITSILILSALLGWLGFRLWGLPAGLLMSAWTLDCEPLLREKTNNHTLASSLLVVALICAGRGPRSIPWGLLALFLATQARQEMWIPFVAAIAIVVVLRIRRGPLAPLRSWIITITIAAAVWGLIAWRMGPKFAFRANCAFGQTFAVSYVERHGLQAEYPQPWMAFHRILRERMPELAPYSRMNPIEALRHHPGEVAGHVLYNMRLALRVVPSMIAKVNHPLLLLLFVVAFVLTIRCERARTDRLVLLWAATAALIVPMLLLYRVTSRYLTPLIPAGIVFAMWLLQKAWCRFKVRSLVERNASFRESGSPLPPAEVPGGAPRRLAARAGP